MSDAAAHTVTLDPAGAVLSHPAVCADTGTCPFIPAATVLPPAMLAIGGTWTCGLYDGHLILLARVGASA